MSLSPTNRTLIFILFFMIFLAGAGPLLFYANGWQWRPKEGRFEKTALLAMKVEPKNTELYLDGTLRNDRHETRSYETIDSIKAGRHAISIKKDGYLSWDKDINFEPGKTVFLEYIQLFPDEASEEISISKTTDGSFIASEESFFLLSQQNGSTFLNAVNANPLNITKKEIVFDEPVTFAAENNGRFLFKTANSGDLHRWFVIENDKMISLYSTFKFAFSKIIFHPEQKNQFFAAEPKRVLILDQDKKTIQQILNLSSTAVIADFLPVKNYFYTIENSPESTALVVYRASQNGLLEKFSTLPLPKLKNPKLEIGPENLLTVFDQEASVLAIINLERDIPTDASLIYGTTGAAQLQNKLFWWKKSTLWLTEPRSMQHLKLADFFEPIITVTGDPLAPTFYVLMPSAITAFNFIGENSIHKTDILRQENLKDLMVSSDKKYLIALQKQKNPKQGIKLFARPIR